MESDEDLEKEYDVEKILGERVSKGRTYYKVRWMGYGPDSDTWEPIENLESCKDLLDAYFERRKRHAEKKLATLNKEGGKSKKPQPARKLNFLLVSSSDEEADTVKDKFWELLEKGKIPLPEHDLYTNVKSCSRTSLPLSLNEGNDDLNDDGSESNESMDDIYSSRQQSASKARHYNERRRKLWRRRANLFSALSCSNPKVLQISRKDEKSSASTAKADHTVNFLRDIHPSTDTSDTSNHSQLKSSEQKHGTSVPSLDPMAEIMAKFLLNAKKARILEHQRHLLNSQKDKSSSKSYAVPPEKFSKSAPTDQSHDHMLEGLTPTLPESPKHKEVLPKMFPIFTGNSLEFVDDNDTSDSTDGNTATVSNTTDTQSDHKHSSTTHHRGHDVEKMAIEMDKETGLFKRPNSLREGPPHSVDQLREKKKISFGDKGSGDVRKEKHMAVPGRHSHSKEMRGERPHVRETESGKKLHSPQKEDHHRKIKTDHDKQWVVKQDGSSHTLTHSDDAANRLILKFAKSHSPSKEKHVHFDRANKPHASKSGIEMSLVKDGTLAVSHSKHSKHDGKSGGKHSYDGSVHRRSGHHVSSVSSSLVRIGKTDDKDSHMKPSSHHSSSKKHLVHKDATKTSGNIESSKDSDQRKDVDNRKEAVHMDAAKTLDMVKSSVSTQPSRDADQRKDAGNMKDGDKRKDVDNRKDMDQRKDVDSGKDADKGRSDHKNGKEIDKMKDNDHCADAEKIKDYDSRKETVKRKDDANRRDDDQRKDADKIIRISENVTIVSSDTIMRNEPCEQKTDAMDKGSDSTESERYHQPNLVSIRNYRIPKKSVVLAENTNSSRVSLGCTSSPIKIETLQKKPLDVCRGSDLTVHNEHRPSTLMSILGNYRGQSHSADLGDASAKHVPSLKRSFDSLELNAPSSKQFCGENRFLTPCIGSGSCKMNETGATLQLKERSTDARKRVEGSNDACHVAGEQIKAVVQPCHGIRKFMNQWPVNFGQTAGYSQRLGIGKTSALSSACGKDARGILVTDDSLARQTMIPVVNTVEDRVKREANCDQIAVKKEVVVNMEEFGVLPSPRSIMKPCAATGIPSLKSIALAAKSRVKGAVQGIKTVQARCDSAEKIWLQEELLLTEIVQRDELQAEKPDRNIRKDGIMRREEPTVTLLQDCKEAVAGNAISSAVQVASLEKVVVGSIVKTNVHSEADFERNCETDAITQSKVPEVLYTGESVEVITNCLSTVNMHRAQSLHTSMPEMTQAESAGMNLLSWIKHEDCIDAEALDRLLWKDCFVTETRREIDAVAHGDGEVNKDRHEYGRAEGSVAREDSIAGMDINDFIYNSNTPSYALCKQEIVEQQSDEQAGTKLQSSGTRPMAEVNKDDLCFRNMYRRSSDSLDEKNFNAVKMNDFHELLEELFLKTNSNSFGEGNKHAIKTSSGEESAEELHDFLASVCQSDVPNEDRDLNRHALALSIVCKSEIFESPEMDDQNSTDQSAELFLSRRLLVKSNLDVVQASSDAVLQQKCEFQDNLSQNITVVRQSDLNQGKRVEVGRICFSPEYADVLERGKPQENELQLSMAEYEKNYLPKGIDCDYPYEAGDVEKHLDLCTGYVNKGNRNLDEYQTRQEIDSAGNRTTLCAATNAGVTEMPSVKENTNVLVTVDKINTDPRRTLLKTSETVRKGILKIPVKESLALLEDHSKDTGEGFGEICHQNDFKKLHNNLSDENVCKMNLELCEGNAHSVEDQSNVSKEVTNVVCWDISAGRRPISDPAAMHADLEMEVEPLNQGIGTEGLQEKQPGATHALFHNVGSVANTETDERHSEMTVVETLMKEKPVKTFNSDGAQFAIKFVPMAGIQLAGSVTNMPLVQQGEAVKTLPDSAYTLRETLKEKFMEGMAKDGIQALRSLINNTNFEAASDTSSPRKRLVSSKKNLSDDEIGLEITTVASSPGSARFTWNLHPSSSKGALNSPAVPSSPSSIKVRATDFGNVRTNCESTSPASNASSSLTDQRVKFNVAAMGLDIRNLPKVVPPSLLNLSSDDLGQAVFKNDVKLVQFALEREGVIWDLEQRDDSGQTLVMAAVRNGNNFLLRLLVERGALVNAKKEDGTTPLMIAAQQGFAKTVRFLLCLGARIDDRTGDGETALIKAARQGHGDVVYQLLDNGANFSPIMAGDVTISEVARSHESMRTIALMHSHCLELDFDCRASAAIKSAGILVRSLFPLQCLTVRDMKCFSMSFNYESLQPNNNSFGALLFIGHAFINYQSVRCLLKMDSYAVKYVTVNGHRQKCVERGESFCWTLVPICQGINYVNVHLRNCMDPKVKLVMRAYQVMSVEQ